MPPEDTDILTPEQVDAEWDRQASVREAGEIPPSDTTQADPLESTSAPAAAPAPAKAPAAAPATQEDPFAGLSPALREKLAKFDQLDQAFARTQNDWKAAQGRIGALQGELDRIKAKPTASQAAEAAKSPEKWEAMKQDFPEWGEAIEALMDTRLGALKPAEAPTFDMNELDRRVQAAVANERKERVEEYVEDKHPGWKQTVNTPEFGEWFKVQPPEVQQLSASPNARDAVRLLDTFSKAKAAPAANVNEDRQARLRQAATSKPGSTPPPKSEDDMSDDELWNHMAKQRERDNKGRFR